MGSLFSILSIARDGIVAQSGALSVTGQNMTNVNTPGYVRRSAILATRPMGLGQSGGVSFEGIARSFDRFAYGHVLSEGGKMKSAEARSNSLATLEGMLAPGEGGMQDRLSDFFSKLTALTSNPTDTTTRKQVLSSAQELATQISSVASQIQTTRGDLLTQSQSAAGELNQKLAKIASLNKDVMQATALSDPAADLRDQRASLVRDVADTIGARVIESDDGNLTLFSAGMTLVESDTSSALQVDLDTAGMLRYTAVRGQGSTADITSQMNAGTLGGLREVRDTDAVATLKSLDQFAFDFASSVNTVQMGGVGLDGVGGRPLFTPIATVAGAAYAFKVDPAIAGNPSFIAAATTVAELPGGSSNAVKLAQLASAPLGGGGAPSDRVASLLGDIGSRKVSADNELTLRANTLSQADNLYQSNAGVSLDEETVNLTKYQRAFEAATKVLQTVDQLLSEFIKGI